MAREEKRLYTVGRFWLAEREQSPFLYIRWYDGSATRGKSTGKRTLDDAIPVILAHEERDRAEGPQEVDEALAVSIFLQFWQERGRTRRNAATVASSLRIFTAFLEHDRVGIGATVADLKPDVFKRFVAWRLAAHHYSIEWLGKVYANTSAGVSGEAVQRNLDDVRAALNYAVAMGRIPYAPKVPSVESDLRSPPRDVTLSIKQLGAIVGYAAHELDALLWVLGMLGTAARPDAVLKWNVAEQWKHRGALFDTHPHGEPRTKKRNAVVPVIPELKPWLTWWADHPQPKVKSRKTWWRTLRYALGLPGNVVPKTIRHTIATELRARGVPQSDVEGLLGHLMSNRVTAVYAKYDPNRLIAAKQALSAIWKEVAIEASEWLTNHKRIRAVRGRNNSVALLEQKSYEISHFPLVGADGLEPPTLSV